MSTPSTGKNRCSYCGGSDHNRRNRKHHPKLRVLVRKKTIGAAAYSRLWRRERVATHTLRGICTWCGDRMTAADTEAQRRMCEGCRKHRNGQQTSLRRARKRYEAALKDIADGCEEPRLRAAQALVAA